MKELVGKTLHKHRMVLLVPFTVINLLIIAANHIDFKNAAEFALKNDFMTVDGPEKLITALFIGNLIAVGSIYYFMKRVLTDLFQQLELKQKLDKE